MPAAVHPVLTIVTIRPACAHATAAPIMERQIDLICKPQPEDARSSTTAPNGGYLKSFPGSLV
jgi:hypothetical protein